MQIKMAENTRIRKHVSQYMALGPKYGGWFSRVWGDVSDHAKPGRIILVLDTPIFWLSEKKCITFTKMCQEGFSTKKWTPF